MTKISRSSSSGCGEVVCAQGSRRSSAAPSERLCLIWPIEGFFKINRARNFEHVRVIFQMASADRTRENKTARQLHEAALHPLLPRLAVASGSNFVQNTFVREYELTLFNKFVVVLLLRVQEWNTFCSMNKVG